METDIIDREKTEKEEIEEPALKFAKRNLQAALNDLSRRWSRNARIRAYVGMGFAIVALVEEIRDLKLNVNVDLDKVLGKE